jgi:membrane-associated PAP2 superfamily phosphatase
MYLPQAPKKALAVFVGGLSIGLTLGWVQQMRGQHFLTHTLWTAWFSSALFLVLLAIFARPLEKAAKQPARVASQARSSILDSSRVLNTHFV